MTTVKKYNIQGKETGSAKIHEKIESAQANGQMVKDYIVALRNNARQWSASTKGRSEVKHTTRKPFKQKGTGNARQGSFVSPQYRGGGIVFGPKPKFDQHANINKKEKKAAIRYLIGEKVRNGSFIVLEDVTLDQPKTKVIANFLKTKDLNRKTLFLGCETTAEVKLENETKRVSARSNKHRNFIKSLQNLPNAKFSLAKNINGYEIMSAHHLVVTESALTELNQWLGGQAS